MRASPSPLTATVTVLLTVVLLAVQRPTTTVSALPYSSIISLAKATTTDHQEHRARHVIGGATPAEGSVGGIDDRSIIGGGAGTETTAEQLEEEQREMLRRAIQLVEPYHHDQYSDEIDSDHHLGGATRPIVIRDIIPPSGPVGGKTTVEIIAEIDEDTALGPFIGRRLSCRFDAIEVELSDQANTSNSESSMKSTWLAEASIQSPTRLTCPSPEVVRPLATKASLVDAASGLVVAIVRPSVSTTFAFYDEPIPVHLEPKQGPLRGGTVVRATLTGYAASAQPGHDEDEVVCIFGSVVVNATWTEPDSIVECASPPAPRVDAMPLIGASFDVPFSISLNGGSGVSPSTLRFSYHGDVRVRSIEPARGSEAGGTAVVVTGDNVHLAMDCAFGEDESAYSFRDHETDGLHCVTPAVDKPRRVELRLKTAQGWVATGMQFVFEKARPMRLLNDQSLDASNFPISILSVWPAFGPSTGGTNVTIVLNAAQRSLVNSTVLCRFDDTITMADVLGDGSLCCLSASTFMDHGVKISHSNFSVSVDDVVSNGILQFTYYQLRRSGIVALKPSVVDAKGGSAVRIYFDSASEVLERLNSLGLLGKIVVRAGSMIIPARYDSASNHLTFSAPAMELDSPAILDVSMSLNGGADFISAPSLQVYPTPELHSVSPSAVQLGLDETVEILGSNFIAFGNVSCRIGDSVTRAVIHSSTTMECALPEEVVEGRALPGIMPVTISLNGFDFVEECLAIVVDVGAMVERILSPYVSESGGTNVTLIGRNLEPVSRGFVALGRDGIRAVLQLTNETHATFVAPPGTGEVDISIGLGHGRLLTETGLSLRYLPPLRIDGVHPPLCAAGEGCSVEIIGNSFDAVFEYTCEIETGDGLIFSGNFSVADGTSSKCEVLAASKIGQAFIYVLRKSDGERSNRIPFAITDGLFLTSVHPSTISEFGGTVVVAGHGFDERSNITCNIESTQHGQEKKLNSICSWISDKEVQCTLEPLSVGNASLRIIEDGFEATSNPLHISVVPAAQIMAVAPGKGGVNGGTKLWVEVSGLEPYADGLLCSFGGGRTSQLGLLNATHGRCISPPGGKGGGQVEFSVLREINAPSGRRLKQAVGMSSSRLHFSYRDPPKILVVTPRQGPSAGGTVVQIVTDANDALLPVSPLAVRLTSRSSSSRIAFARAITFGADGTVTAVLPPSPDGSNGGTCLIEFSLNGQEYAYGGATFTFTPSMYIQKISPPMVPAMSEIDIAVFGDNFGNVSTPLWCRINGITEDAAWISNGMVQCPIPESLKPGTYKLELSSNNVDFFSAPSELLVRPEIRVIGASSLFGPIRGGGKVTMRGAGFQDSGEVLHCVFGEERVKAVVVDDTQIQCKVPPRPIPGSCPIFLSIDPSLHSSFSDGQVRTSSDVLDANLVFHYYADEVIVNVEPNLGPERGGTVVSVRGRNFQDHPLPSCKIGASIVPAVFYDSEHVGCVVPPVLEALGPENGLSVDNNPVAAWITVSNNGIDWLDAGFEASATFSYYTEPSFDRLYPSIVSPTGQVPVQIKIDGNVVDGHGVMVQVADTVVPARVSQNSIVFDAPPMRVGTIANVKISFNSADFTSDVLELRYLDAPVLYEISPTVGPAWGLNVVTLIGRNFGSVTNMHVEFGSSVVPATILSEGKAICIAPASSIGAVNVRVLHGENVRLSAEFDNDDGEVLLYEYLREIALNSVTPRSGPTRGSTELVISGNSFPAIDELFCFFGEALSLAERLNSDQITCSSPPATNASMVAVHVGIVGADNAFVPLSQSSIQFQYYEEPFFGGIYPSRALIAGGGIVKITLNNTFIRHDSFHCQFGYEVVAGEGLGDGMVSCVVPGRDAGGPENIGVSFNDQDYHHVGIFYYHEVPSVLSVSPSHGWAQGGTKVNVSGVGFHPGDEKGEGLMCDFGGRQIEATFVDSSLVRCSAPSHIASTVKPTIIYFPHANDVSIRAESNATFEYVEQIEVAQTFPSILPSSAKSGTEYLDVRGSNFREDETACRFYLWLPSNATVSHYREMLVETTSTFINTSYVRCGPGVPGLDAFFQDDSLQEMVRDSAMVDASFVELTITTNRQEYSKPLSLTFAADSVVKSIYPSLGSVTGGTEVVFRGERFIVSDTLQCRFGIKVVVALFVSATELVCQSPPMRTPATVLVEVSVNGRDFSRSGVAFRYHEELYLETVTPALSPSIGGVTTAIVIGGGVVDEGMQIVCRFNTTHANATIINESTITCKSPAANAEGGAVPLSVSFNDGVDFVDGLDFLYTPGQKSEMMSLSPSHGPKTGGSRVVVSGLAGFGSVGTASLKDLTGICRFGNVVVPAIGIFEDGTSMVCTSPPKQEKSAAWVPVDAAYLPTKEALTSAGVIFIYDDNIDLHDIWPATGPLTGKTPVRIQGGPFIVGPSDELLCRFGEQIVPGTWHSKSEIGCVAPSVGDGSVSVIVDVSVTINGQDFSESSLQYTYHSLVIVNQLSPRHGPISGGTIITLQGEYFELSSDLTCWFGSMSVTPLTIENSTHITCQAPPAIRPGGVEVHVSLNGFIPPYNVSAYSQIYDFEELLHIDEVDPPFGPSRGNSSIVISGGPFVDHSSSEEMFCRFGEMEPVPAEYLSPSQIRCSTPPHLPKIATLQVTQNAQDYSPIQFAFEFYPNEVIHHFHPTFGPRSGSRSLHIHGENFRNNSLTTCRFDDIQVPTLFINTTEIHCETPTLNSTNLIWQGLNEIPLDTNDGTVMFPIGHNYPSYLGRAVAVEVSNNQLDFTDQTIQYWFYEDAELSFLSPTTGPYWGGTPIFMKGSNFINSTSLSCRIGAWKTKAQYLDRTSALCFTPPQALVEADAGPRELHDIPLRPQGALLSTVYVSLSNNGMDFTNPLVFQYEEASHPGSYQPSVTSVSALRCPRGTFCLGGSSNFTLCFEGTYQPLMGQYECLECPIGYHCPEVGMIQPRICPAGRVCSETGLGRKLAPCPTGHLCGLGTATLETTCGIRRSGCFDNSTDDFGLQFDVRKERFSPEFSEILRAVSKLWAAKRHS